VPSTANPWFARMSEPVAKKVKEGTQHLSHSELLKLKRWNTPTIYNGTHPTPVRNSPKDPASDAKTVFMNTTYPNPAAQPVFSIPIPFYARTSSAPNQLIIEVESSAVMRSAQHVSD